MRWNPPFATANAQKSHHLIVYASAPDWAPSVEAPGFLAGGAERQPGDHREESVQATQVYSRLTLDPVQDAMEKATDALLARRNPK